jgi:hypothetical protein
MLGRCCWCILKQAVRFTYCGEPGLKPEEQPRSNFRQIRRSAAPAGTIASKELPEGSEPVERMVASKELPEGSEPVELIIDGKRPAVSVEKLSTWAKLGALGGFGSVFIILFAFAFNPLLIMLMLPLSIIGLVFSSKVLKRTRNRPEFKKQRRMSKWSFAMATAWLGLSVLYILIAILVLFLFIL